MLKSSFSLLDSFLVAAVPILQILATMYLCIYFAYCGGVLHIYLFKCILDYIVWILIVHFDIFLWKRLYGYCP